MQRDKERDKEKVRWSALWAAYGDALGFMSELADEEGVRYRIGESYITRTVPWRRRIGGKFGPSVELPAGTYSDDTQLRLAAGRAIRGDGRFDVEAFAKVELPVWLSYALGAGRGTRAAATALSRENTTWVTNFYRQAEQDYLASGGNGAAIRIQPHIWAANDRRRPETYLLDVIRDAITTHGHPRAILGAIFHALAVADAIEEGSPPSPDRWQEYVKFFVKIPELILADRELRDFWLPLWEQKSSKRLSAAFENVALECDSDLRMAQNAQHLDERAYCEFVVGIGGTLADTRGSATKTAIAAAVLAWHFRSDAERALLTAANLLRSDTDSICSMAGALLGPPTGRDPSGEIQDKAYLISEANRLADIGNGLKTASFAYPDLLTWRPPRTQADALAKANGKLIFCGLGFAEPLEKTYVGKGKPTPVWQWLRLDHGQTVLAKRREDVEEAAIQNLPAARATVSPQKPPSEQTMLFPFTRREEPAQRRSYAVPFRTTDLHQLTREAIDSDFDPRVIGEHLMALTEQEDGIEQSIAYVAIVAKARRARIEAGRRGR
jgi:ADP-ribosylglycohydrolase